MTQAVDTAVEVPEVPNDLQVKAAEAVLSPFTVETLVERVELVKEAMRRCMVEDLHYGKIPGCGKKPVLLKPGAEMLGTLFNLGQRYRMQERLLPGDHVVYTVNLHTILSAERGGHRRGAGGLLQHGIQVADSDRATDARQREGYRAEVHGP
jgi:hypothetical protein